MNKKTSLKIAIAWLKLISATLSIAITIWLLLSYVEVITYNTTSTEHELSALNAFKFVNHYYNSVQFEIHKCTELTINTDGEIIGGTFVNADKTSTWYLEVTDTRDVDLVIGSDYKIYYQDNSNEYEFVRIEKS